MSAVSKVQQPLPLDVERLRRDFPILIQRVRNKSLVYLDNGATTQKPQSVIDALVSYYTTENANIHRGVHYLSQQATFAYERTRGRIRRFLNAADNSEIIFVRGTTEGINLVAQSFARPRLREGDQIIVSHMEHHSNIVPWQMVCAERNARLRVIPVDDTGELILEEYEKLLTPRTRLVALAHASNVLGTINPVARIAALPISRGCRCWWTGPRASPICRWTCANWAAISTCSRATNSSAPPASGCSMAAGSCSNPCRPIRAGAR